MILHVFGISIMGELLRFVSPVSIDGQLLKSVRFYSIPSGLLILGKRPTNPNTRVLHSNFFSAIEILYYILGSIYSAWVKYLSYSILEKVETLADFMANSFLNESICLFVKFLLGIRNIRISLFGIIELFR